MDEIDNKTLFDIVGASEYVDLDAGTLRQLMAKYPMQLAAHKAFNAGLVPNDTPITGIKSEWAQSVKTGKPVRAFRVADLDAYLVRPKVAGRSGAPGGVKWMKVLATPQALEAIRQLEGVKELKSAFNYDPAKSKSYRIKRQQAAAAKKAAKAGPHVVIPEVGAAEAFAAK
jgi:hypothetical protein